MPELAEVEAVRRQLVKHLKGRKIQEIIADKADRFLFAFVSIPQVTKALKGARITGAGRKGKYFWLELDRKPWPVFHLGMTGNVAILNPQKKSAPHEQIWGGVQLWSAKDLSDRERLWFCRLLLKTDRGFEVALLDPRRFGRMWLTDDPWEHSRIKRLGPDPMIDFPNARVLAEKLKRRKKSIKSVLLDQALFAGVGNWLADEILYQARLAPHHLAADLTPAQVKKLHASVLSVVKKAVSVDADYERFPKSWLFHERWGKKTNAKTSKGKIVHEEIGGRTTAWVPGWQK